MEALNTGQYAERTVTQRARTAQPCSRLSRERLHQRAGIRQLVEIQHRHQLIELGGRQNAAGELGEFRRDIAGRCKMTLAAARRLDGLFENGAVAQMHRDAYGMARFRAARGDLRILARLDLRGSPSYTVAASRDDGIPGSVDSIPRREESR